MLRFVISHPSMNGKENGVTFKKAERSNAIHRTLGPYIHIDVSLILNPLN